MEWRSHSNIIPSKSHLLRLYIPWKLTKDPTSVEIPAFNDCVRGANPARMPSTTLPGSIPPCSIFHSSAFAWMPRASAHITMKPITLERATMIAMKFLHDGMMQHWHKGLNLFACPSLEALAFDSIVVCHTHGRWRVEVFPVLSYASLSETDHAA